MLESLASSVALSWGWPRRLIALLAGAVSSLAMAPFHLFPLLWLTLPVLVWLIDGAVSLRRSGGTRLLLPAFAVGWWFGFGYFLAGLWWIGIAFTVDADDFGWLLPIGVIAVPAGLALFFGLGTALAQLLWSEGPGRVFALAAGLGVAELARGTLLTGFPWNALGYALLAGDTMLQSISLVGLYGLNVLAVFVFAAPAAIAPRGTSLRAGPAVATLAVLVVAALAAFGWWRLAAAGPPVAEGRPIRVVQPGIDQAAKWQVENRASILDRLREATSPSDAVLAAGTLVVWPETALPFGLAREPAALERIADLLPEGAHLLTGAARVDDSAGGTPAVFNTMALVDADGVIVDGYDKVHLVPFGEFVPFADLVRRLGLGPLLDVRGAFAPGDRRRTLVAGGGPRLLPLICYEAIFPGSAAAPGEPRPDLIVNITNDTWFGRSPGPFQHFHQARAHAVEEGLPLVRAANSGISAVTDPYGRVLARLGLDATGRIDARLPPVTQPTIASRYQFMIVSVLLALFASVALFSKNRN